MIQLASQELCTGCGACAFACAKKCISMQEDSIGQVYPVLNTENCVECHNCQNVCPALNQLTSVPARKAYAAWSNNVEERRTSASGGIAIELYKQAISLGYKAIGATQEADFSVHHQMVSDERGLQQLKNSKYVFSDAYSVYPQIRTELRNGGKVLFIGLPCQVAALRRLFKDDDNLLLGEVICHGTTPYSYLKQHISAIAKQTSMRPVKMSFRDAAMQTFTYTLTLYSEGTNPFYAKRTKDGDTYQFGYHRAVSYRKNCYNCMFAKPQRNADFTLGDYHGLGLLQKAPYNAQKVSLLLDITSKGRDFIERAIASNKLHADARPLNEPFLGEVQLNHPSPRSKYRILFEEQIVKHQGDFEKAIALPLELWNKDMRWNKLLSFPRRIARKLKQITSRRK